MEISLVRRQVQAAITSARERARRRRERTSEAEQAYDRFLDAVAVPLARQVANALKVEGHPFSVSTPGRGLRLTSDHARDDFIELELRTGIDVPTVIGRIRRTRGSRTLEEERPITADTPPQELTESDLLEFFLGALEPWLER